jgi:hypothetical protein
MVADLAFPSLKMFATSMLSTPAPRANLRVARRPSNDMAKQDLPLPKPDPQRAPPDPTRVPDPDPTEIPGRDPPPEKLPGRDPPQTPTPGQPPPAIDPPPSPDGNPIDPRIF